MPLAKQDGEWVKAGPGALASAVPDAQKPLSLVRSDRIPSSTTGTGVKK